MQLQDNGKRQGLAEKQGTSPRLLFATTHAQSLRLKAQVKAAYLSHSIFLIPSASPCLQAWVVYIVLAMVFASFFLLGCASALPAQNQPLPPASQQASKGIIESILEWFSGLFGG